MSNLVQWKPFCPTGWARTSDLLLSLPLRLSPPARFVVWTIPSSVLDGSRLVSTPSCILHHSKQAWLGVGILKRSPNLTAFTYVSLRMCSYLKAVTLSNWVTVGQNGFLWRRVIESNYQQVTTGAAFKAASTPCGLLSNCIVVPPVGIEPTTKGLWILCSTTEL